MVTMPPLSINIGALAEQTGFSVPTIRYYEEIGLVPPAHRQLNGYRVYGDEDQRRLLFIRRCRDFGFSIDQVRALMALSGNPAADPAEACALAESHLDTIRATLNELKTLEQTLTLFVERCTAARTDGSASQCAMVADLTTPTDLPRSSPDVA